MLNNQLKNNIAPWQENGRWYHIFVESDGTKAKITQTDVPIDRVTGTAIAFKDKAFYLIDYVLMDSDIAPATTVAKNIIKTASSTGEMAITIPPYTSYTYLDIWVFGYYKETAQTSMAKTMMLTDDEPVDDVVSEKVSSKK